MTTRGYQDNWMDTAGDDSTLNRANQEETDMFNLTRKNFLLNYRLHYALKTVFIMPFRAEIFACPEFHKWISMASELSIKRAWNGKSAAMMTFGSYGEADDCICDLRHILGEDVVIKHNRGHGDGQMDRAKYYSVIDVDSLLDSSIRDSLATRTLVLEGLPSETTQEQISEFFPDARTTMLVQHDPANVTGLALLEYPSTELAESVLTTHRVDKEDDRSYIVVEGTKVQLSKYKNRLNLAERIMRRQPKKDNRKTFDKKAMSDNERLNNCATLREIWKAREACLDDYQLEPPARVLRYVEFSEDMSVLAASLNWDADRREKEKLPLPEPDHQKTWRQLYREDQSYGGDAYVKPESSNGEAAVPSLLDLNPFELHGNKRTQRMPMTDPVPPVKKRSTYSTEVSDTESVEGCMQKIKQLSTQLTSQVQMMESMLQGSSSSQASKTTYNPVYHSKPTLRDSHSRSNAGYQGHTHASNQPVKSLFDIN